MSYCGNTPRFYLFVALTQARVRGCPSTYSLVVPSMWTTKRRSMLSSWSDGSATQGALPGSRQ
jgi:hypothetical protein